MIIVPILTTNKFINSSHNFFDSEIFDDNIIIGSNVTFLMFKNCVLNKKIILSPCSPIVGSFEVLVGTDQIPPEFSSYNFVIIESNITAIEFNFECFEQKTNKIVIANNTFNINHNISCLVDLKHAKTNSFEFVQNIFYTSSIGLSRVEAGLQVENVNTTTSTLLRIIDNKFCNILNPCDNEGYQWMLSDQTILESGIVVNSNSILELASVLSTSGYSFVLSSFQSLPRSMKLSNIGMFGYSYDVRFTINEQTNCKHVCKDQCNSCLIDPTRFNEENVCFDRTLFHRWPMIGYGCTKYNNIFALKVEYPQETIVFNRSLIISSNEQIDFVGPLNGGSFTIVDNPIITHGNIQASNPFSATGSSIVMRGTSIKFNSIQFNIVGTNVFPFFGVLLFTTDMEILGSITFNECEIHGNSLDQSSILFNTITMDDAVVHVNFTNCLIEWIVFDLIPDILDTLYMVGNEVNHMINGIIDVEIEDWFVIMNNFGNDVTFTPDCFGIFCIRDTTCSIESCRFQNNSFNSTIEEVDFPSYAGNLYSMYKFENVAIKVDEIDENSNLKVPYGIEYANMPLIPCNFTMLKTIKENNVDVIGWEADIICDRDLVTEKSCSGLCLVPQPPPSFCIVDSTVLVSNPNYFHSIFPTISSALDNCQSSPTLHIKVLEDQYLESGLVFDPNDGNQINFTMEANSNVVIIGHSHTISTLFLSVSFIGSIVFQSQVFPTFTPLNVGNIISGIVLNVFMRNITFKALSNENEVPLGLNSPDVDNLLDIILLGRKARFVDIQLFGSKKIAMRIIDGNQANPNTGAHIILEKIEGKSHLSSLLDVQGVNKIHVNGVECIQWCGAFDAANSVFRVMNKETVSLSNKFEMNITNVNVQLTNITTQQWKTVIGGGPGYISGIWIENPVIDVSFVKSFILTGLTSLDYPVGLRFVDITEEIIELSEPIGSFPIFDDLKRGMRETTRFNNIEGTIYDLKNGGPAGDDLLHPSNTCNDLCLPPEWEICRVDRDFSTLTPGFGTRVFHSVQNAIASCISTLLPMPIQLHDPDANGIVIKEHTEDIVFNASKSIRIYGPVSSLDGSRVKLIGNHVLDVGTCDDRVIIEDIELNSNTNAPVIFGVDIQYDLEINRIWMIGNTTTSFIKYSTTCGSFYGDDILVRVSTPKSIIYVEFSGLNNSAKLNKLNVDNSFGPAVHFIGVSYCRLANMVLVNCFMIEPVSLMQLPACIIVQSADDGLIFTRNNQINRDASAFSRVPNTANGTFFSAFWFETENDFFLNDTNDIGTFNEIKGWNSNTDGTSVGIRINNIEFSPRIMVLSQLLQKEFARKISINNIGISSSFHDVVINQLDNQIKTNPSGNERLFCSDGCPLRIYSTENWIFIGILIGGAFLVILFLLLCPTFFINFKGGHHFVNPNIGMREYRRSKGIRRWLTKGRKIM